MGGYRVGFEVEFLLELRSKHVEDFAELEDFTNYLVTYFNNPESRATRRPKPHIHNDVDGVYEGKPGTEWSFTDDVTITPENDNDHQCMPLCLFMILSIY
jgi:hypothetical protein